MSLRALGPVEAVPDGGSAGYEAAAGGFTGLFAIRRGADIRVYVNACPHIGASLDWVPGRFLSADGQHIVCAIHGAEFSIDTGACTSGPCFGDRLESVMVQIRDGIIFVPADAGL